ncbi:YgjP-like metallopeptidase domain-containing protein [Mycoplasma seminis]|uniref:DUF45 domain-containing protein n=1 Tax=Mycoplasma seminis TaxID=512749 RepID=A0ABY9HAA4_9MOLU|nr:YgjP-like metallopeptidase domain-containing protein [Mycoplasma seminis]WLP85522.1 DUF45 domain-containing protein [Mycoplasma seminis]
MKKDKYQGYEQRQIQYKNKTIPYLLKYDNINSYAKRSFQDGVFSIVLNKNNLINPDKIMGAYLKRMGEYYGYMLSCDYNEFMFLGEMYSYTYKNFGLIIIKKLSNNEIWKTLDASANKQDDKNYIYSIVKEFIKDELLKILQQFTTECFQNKIPNGYLYPSVEISFNQSNYYGIYYSKNAKTKAPLIKYVFLSHVFPLSVLKYLAVHEASHHIIRVLNPTRSAGHNKFFWKIVNDLEPNSKKLDWELKNFSSDRYLNK